MERSFRPLLEQQLPLAGKLMLRGVHTEPVTGLNYFTGYGGATLYDWDQYFEAIAQFYLGWPVEYAVNAIRIFLANQNQDTGFIPRCIRTEEQLREAGTEIYSHEQTEMVKPFLAQLGVLCVSYSEDTEWLSETLLKKLDLYLTYWMDARDTAMLGLSVWDSGPHSGMDTQHERCGHWGDCFGVGVDLNSFLVRECRALACLARHADDSSLAAKWARRAEIRAETIREKLWCDEKEFFFDLDARTSDRIPVLHAGAFATLWGEIATPYQARRMISDYLLNPCRFWRPFPVPAYAAGQDCYSEERLSGDVGCLWRANTWAPTNYYISHALRAYDYQDLASILGERTLQLVERNGLCEYYTSESGRGCGQDPFWGWTVTSLFMPLEERFGFFPTMDPENLPDTRGWVRIRDAAAKLVKAGS